MPEKAQMLPALGVMAIAIETVSDSLTKFIQNLHANDGGFCAKVVDVFRSRTTDHVLSVECTMLDKHEKPLINYCIYPWHQVDPRLPRLFKPVLPMMGKVLFSDLKQTKIQVGDRLVKVDFGQNANAFIAMKIEDVEFDEQIAKMMAQEADRMPNIDIGDIVKGEIVACQWSEDEAFYRAAIIDINLPKRKVKVRFVDYGNVSIESIDNVRLLPHQTLKYPALAKLIKLVSSI